jgi:hypothetical protein
MPIRYYPAAKIKQNKITRGDEFLLNGEPYSGKYYETFDGRAFTGANPILGDNKELSRVQLYKNSEFLNFTALSSTFKRQFANQTNQIAITQQTAVAKSEPTSYFPVTIQQDYDKGFFMRYFAKRENLQGYVIEISQSEYASIVNGTAVYDISMWQVLELFWKLTGPLNQVRISQYDVRAGIIDTNKRLVENSNKTFLGIKDFINEDYAKFSRPTE